MKITILGAGAMGAALTVPLTDRRHTVALWCTDHDDAIHRALIVGESHPNLGTRLPDSVLIFESAQIEKAIEEAELLILGVSTPGVLPVIEQASPYLRRETPVLTLAKGFLSYQHGTEPLPSGIRRKLQNSCSGTEPPVLSMTGPSIAGELVRRQPTAAAVASEGNTLGMVEAVCERLATDYFWLDSIPDSQSLEICLAYKNIYSIALAWAEGLNESGNRTSTQNLSAILLLQAVDELQKIIGQRHGNPDTANGWAGLGDLVATAGGGRNGRFGQLLATGKSPEEAAEILEKQGVTTIEGRSALPHGVDYAAQTFDSDWPARLPLLHAIQQVVAGEANVREVMQHIHRFRESKSTTNIPER